MNCTEIQNFDDVMSDPPDHKNKKYKKYKNTGLWCGNIWKSVKHWHRGDKRHNKVHAKTKTSKSTDEAFFTPTPLSKFCLYLKIGLYDLLPVLLEHVKYTDQCNTHGQILGGSGAWHAPPYFCRNRGTPLIFFAEPGHLCVGARCCHFSS